MKKYIHAFLLLCLLVFPAPFTARAEVSAARLVRASVSSTGDMGNAASNTGYKPALSGDGRYLVFFSYATNLVDQPIRYNGNLYLFDQVTRQTELVSLGMVEIDYSSPRNDFGDMGVSDDGRFVVFEYYSEKAPYIFDGLYNIYVRDRLNQTTEIINKPLDGVSLANGYSYDPVITPDGRYVVFFTKATNLIPGKSDWGVMLKDRQTGSLTVLLANVTAESMRITPDLRYLTFLSNDQQLPLPFPDRKAVFIKDITSGVIENISYDGRKGKEAYSPSISDDGRFISYGWYIHNGTSSGGDLRDRQNNTVTTFVSRNSNTGGPGNPRMSGDGKAIAYSYQVPGSGYNGATVSQGQVYEIETKNTFTATLGHTGEPAYTSVQVGALSRNHNVIAFCTDASNILPDGGNGITQAYLRNMGEGLVGFFSEPATAPANGRSSAALIVLNGTPGQVMHIVSDRGSTDMITPQYGAVDASGRLQFQISSSVMGSSTLSLYNDTTGAWVSEPIPFQFVQPLPSTTRISVPPGGLYPAISSNGRYVVYTANNNIYFYDWDTDTTEQVSLTPSGGQPDGASSMPDVSDDGRFVVFNSSATNIVPGASNEYGQVFLRDRLSGTNELISRSTSGQPANLGAGGPVISSDGRYVMFISESSNLFDWDTSDGYTVDYFVRDRLLGTTEVVSVGTTGYEHNHGGLIATIGGDMSGDGRYVVFASENSNLVPGDTNGRIDVFYHDRQLKTTVIVPQGIDGSPANHDSYLPTISEDGRFVAYESKATNLTTLVPVEYDPYVTYVYLRDMSSPFSDCISLTPQGEMDGSYTIPDISSDGRAVVFQGRVRNRAQGYYGLGLPDIYLYDRLAGKSEKVSVASDGQPGAKSLYNDYISDHPAVSRGGLRVVFHSPNIKLVGGDANNKSDIFLRERSAPAYPFEDRSFLFIPQVTNP